MEREKFKEMLKDVLPELMNEHLSVEIDHDSHNNSIEVSLLWDGERIYEDFTYLP